MTVEHLLQFTGGYGVARTIIAKKSSLIGSKKKYKFPGEDFTVPGIEREVRYRRP